MTTIVRHSDASISLYSPQDAFYYKSNSQLYMSFRESSITLRLFIDLNPFTSLFVVTLPLYPPPSIREGEMVMLEGLHPSKTPYEHIWGGASLNSLLVPAILKEKVGDFREGFSPFSSTLLALANNMRCLRGALAPLFNILPPLLLRRGGYRG